jgi:hypothetical protein
MGKYFIFTLFKDNEGVSFGLSTDPDQTVFDNYSIIDQLWNPDTMSYIISGKEHCPDSDRNHEQGYIEFKKNIRLSGLKKIHPTAKWINRLSKDPIRAANYCKKGDQPKEEWESDHSDGPNFGKNARVLEDGTISNAKPGKRTDLDDFKIAVKRKASDAELTEDHSEIMAKYPGFCYKYRTMATTARLLELQEPLVLKMPWQQELFEHIDGPIPKRRITWLWSDESETGKTSTMQYMQKFKGSDSVLSCNSWKLADILYAYDEHKIIWFNLPRHEVVNDTVWKVLEQLSDGGLQFCGKYASMQKYVKAHIIVTTNLPPAKAREMLPARIVEIHAPLLSTVPDP